jgi:methylmalonyl-CoA mutase cobalamin-binding subunit
MGIFKVVRPDKDVVSGDQVHHPEESRRGNITREALNDTGFEVNHHGVSETLCHERHALVVGGDVSALSKMRENFDVRR